MARETNAMITYEDAIYMVNNEGFVENEPIPLSDVCMTSEKITQYLNADTTRYSDYVDKQLVPYHLLEPLKLDCGATHNGSVGNFTYTIDFGSQTGYMGIYYDPDDIPDKFTLMWNNITKTTGWVGTSSMDEQLINKLNELGLDTSNINTTSGSNHSGYLIINKTSASPSTATIVVNGVLTDTGWRVTGKCVGTVGPQLSWRPIDPYCIPKEYPPIEINNTNYTSIEIQSGVTIPGTISMTVSGGVPPYYYYKIEGGFWSSATMSDQHTFTGITEGGTYIIYVKDNEGNVAETTVTIPKPRFYVNDPSIMRVLIGFTPDSPDATEGGIYPEQKQLFSNLNINYGSGSDLRLRNISRVCGDTSSINYSIGNDILLSSNVWGGGVNEFHLDINKIRQRTNATKIHFTISVAMSISGPYGGNKNDEFKIVSDIALHKDGYIRPFSNGSGGVYFAMQNASELIPYPGETIMENPIATSDPCQAFGGMRYIMDYQLDLNTWEVTNDLR